MGWRVGNPPPAMWTDRLWKHYLRPSEVLGHVCADESDSQNPLVHPYFNPSIFYLAPRAWTYLDWVWDEFSWCYLGIYEIGKITFNYWKHRRMKETNISFHCRTSLIASHFWDITAFKIPSKIALIQLKCKTTPGFFFAVPLICCTTSQSSLIIRPQT